MRLKPIRLVVTLALVILTAPLAAETQQPARVPRIGVLLTLYAPVEDPPEAFRQGLRALGYIEGQNLAIEWRAAEGKYDQPPPQRPYPPPSCRACPGRAAPRYA